jgi:hypothetical protein
MPTVGTNVRTLADWANTRGDNDKYADIVEMLSQDNAILEDMLWREGNLPTGHKTTVRTGLPASTWRAINAGVAPTKGTAAPVTFATALLEQRSQVDVELANLEDDLAAFRLGEGKAHIEAMGQDMASNTFYGNETLDPERFTGFARYYNTLNTNTAASAENVISCGGTGNDQTSAYLVRWGEANCHGIYPKGSNAGLVHNDLGEGDAFETGNTQNRFRAYMDQYKWACGLALRDWRSVVRVANIDSTTIRQTDAPGLAALQLLLRNMITATERLRGEGSGGVFYVNRTVRTALRHAILDRVSSNLTWESVSGKRVMMFDEYPVKVCDALLNTEAPVA